MKLKDILPNKSYLVGGTVRGIILNRLLTDLDLVVEGLTGAVVKKWGLKLGLTIVELDRKRGTFRLAG